MSSDPSGDLELRIVEASSVILHQVPAGQAETFVEWQRATTASAREFPGYVKTEVFPPTGEDSLEWVVVVHFQNHERLMAWLESPQRAERVAQLEASVGTSFSMKTLEGGFGAWFAELSRAHAANSRGRRDLPPGWKMALVVLLALYPAVMLLTLFVSPWIEGFGMSFSMLVSNALSVSILQWGLMPRLTHVMHPWLSASPQDRPLLNFGGAAGIVAGLVAVAALFHYFTH